MEKTTTISSNKNLLATLKLGLLRNIHPTELRHLQDDESFSYNENMSLCELKRDLNKLKESLSNKEYEEYEQPTQIDTKNTKNTKDTKDTKDIDGNRENLDNYLPSFLNIQLLHSRSTS